MTKHVLIVSLRLRLTFDTHRYASQTSRQAEGPSSSTTFQSPYKEQHSIPFMEYIPVYIRSI